MKINHCLKSAIFLGIFSLSLYLNAQEIKSTKGNIDEVTVFLNGATISETVNVYLPKGNHWIEVNQIPNNIDASKVSAQCPDNLNLLSIQYGLHDYKEIQNHPTIKHITDSIELILNKQKANNYSIEALKLELDMLKKNIAIGGQNNGVNILDLQKAMVLYRAQQEDIYTRLLKHELVEKDIQKKYTDLNNRKNISTAKILLTNGKIKLQVKTEMAGNYSFKVKYFTNNAAWKPLYDIKVEDVGKPMNITQKGKIMNRSGKDWNNVSMVLSTADPSISIIRPDLLVWELDYQQLFYKKPSFRGARTSGDDYYEDGDKPNSQLNSAVRKDEMRNQNSNENTIAISEISNDFTILEKANIDNGEETQTIDIRTYTMNAWYEYVSIPKLENIPYLIGKTTDWQKLPLSDGPASIFIGNNYIGESYISVAEISDTMEISLGRNKKVSVDRKKKLDKTSKSWMGGSITESFTYETSIKNNNQNNIVFELWDQIPVSKQENITVNVSEISGAQLDDKTGKLVWRFDLKPGEERKVTISFSVKYPKDKKVEVQKARSLSCPTF